MIKIEGKNGISATVIKDSISRYNHRMTTFELEYPRFIHSELMTHRMLSKNAASSRAIPIASMIENIKKNTAMPVYWGMNQPGMKAKEEAPEDIITNAQFTWRSAMDYACRTSEILSELGLHKQVPNRLTEPFQMMKTVISGTEWTNFLWLRNHPDAQPEFKELASCVQEAFDKSSPSMLLSDEWHLPYVESHRDHDGTLFYYDNDDNTINLEDAKMISVSCCAQVSYRKNDSGVEKARKIFDMLNIGSTTQPPHMSPLEHQATPMVVGQGFVLGVTHLDSRGKYWSGNLCGWIQNRKLYDNEAKW